MSTKPKERPVTFFAPHVRAILEGSKTQMRVPVRDQKPDWSTFTFEVDVKEREFFFVCGEKEASGLRPILATVHCPYGQVGERLWVRETFRFSAPFDSDSPALVADRSLDAGYSVPWAPIEYDADGARRDWRHTGTPPHSGEPLPGKTRPSSNMPRWASRLQLEIVSVRIERLQEISDDDCWAEGLEACDGLADDLKIIEAAKRMGRQFEDAAPSYAALWDLEHGEGSWDANPWVWVIEFRRASF